MSASLGLVWVTALIASLIASADSGSAAKRQLVGDEGDLVVGQLAAEQGEERHVVVLGHAFRVAGPEPVDDLGEEVGECHGFRTFPVRPGLGPAASAWRAPGGRSGRPRRRPSRWRRGRRGSSMAAMIMPITLPPTRTSESSAPPAPASRAVLGPRDSEYRPDREEGRQAGTGDQSEDHDLPKRAQVDPGHVLVSCLLVTVAAALRPRPASACRPARRCRSTRRSRCCGRPWCRASASR